MGGWFGDLDLAYKYTIVFASLLAFTIVAGLIKVFIDRRKLRKFANEKDEENSPREDQMELNRREKDEGDLFGIRAIEAGYFAGIPQSRPTSRAGSIVGGPTMSSTTLVGATFNSPKFHSTASSVTSLPLAHTYDRRDSDTLPSTTRRPSPPAIRLRPSEAELNGRINHSATVSVVLDVPSSPVHTQSQRFSGSDSGDSDDQTLKSGHYSPVAPQVPMENHLHVAVVAANGAHRSHAASVNDLSPLSSPNCSAPPSPGQRPLSYVPSMPDQLNRDESWTQRPVSYRPEQPTQQTTSEQSDATTILLPRTYEPAHRRKSSDASSIYSEKQTSSAKSTHSRNFSLPSNATRNSVAAPSVRSEESWLPPLPPTNLAPLPSHEAANDPRFSAFYDAYFRNSRLNEGLQFDAHGQGLGISQASTIENENETPEPGIAL